MEIDELTELVIGRAYKIHKGDGLKLVDTFHLVPTLRVGTHSGRDRVRRRCHAERGSE